MKKINVEPKKSKAKVQPTSAPTEWQFGVKKIEVLEKLIRKSPNLQEKGWLGVSRATQFVASADTFAIITTLHVTTTQTESNPAETVLFLSARHDFIIESKIDDVWVRFISEETFRGNMDPGMFFNTISIAHCSMRGIVTELTNATWLAGFCPQAQPIAHVLPPDIVKSIKGIDEFPWVV